MPADADQRVLATKAAKSARLSLAEAKRVIARDRQLAARFEQIGLASDPAAIRAVAQHARDLRKRRV